MKKLITSHLRTRTERKGYIHAQGAANLDFRSQTRGWYILGLPTVTKEIKTALTHGPTGQRELDSLTETSGDSRLCQETRRSILLASGL